MKWRILAPALVVLVVSLVSVPTAHATSTYDSLIEPSATAMIGGGPCSTDDVTNTWSTLVHDPATTTVATTQAARDQVTAALDAAQSAGSGVSLVQQTSYDTNILHYVSVVITPSSNPATFETLSDYLGEHQYLKVVNSLTIDIYKDGYDNCTTKLYFSTSSTERILAQPFDQVRCYGGYCDRRQPVYVGVQVTYPSGYEGVRAPSNSSDAEYVAMGDSYSSGEGNPPFEYGTDNTANLCHRSNSAWPIQLAPEIQLSGIDLAACSGAISDYIINSYNLENVELPQAIHITDSTKLVTITIGGNDVDFGKVLTACTLAIETDLPDVARHNIERARCLQAMTLAANSANNPSLQDKLRTVYTGLRSIGSANMQVVVVGYPDLLPAYSDIVGACVWGNGALTTSGRNISKSEIDKARMIHDRLNTTVQQAVVSTNDPNIHFVDPSATFAGHELCRPTPWFNNVWPTVDPFWRQASYHPNDAGQTAYANAVKPLIQSLFP